MAIKDLTPWGRKRRQEESRVPAPRDVEELFRETFEHPFRSWLMAPWRLAGRELYRFSPDVDVSETATDYRVTAELPGLTKDDVSVSLEEGVLTISGEKKEEKKEEEENY